MNKQKVKELFIDLYLTICQKGFIEHNVVTMGNLALYTDQFLWKPSSIKTVMEIRRMMDENRGQELLFLLANGVYDISKRDGLGENLEYRLKQITRLFEVEKLKHFDILLDEYDFPAWFQAYMPYLACDGIKEVCEQLIRDLKGNPSYSASTWSMEDTARLLGYINKKYSYEKRLKYLLPVIDEVCEGEPSVLHEALRKAQLMSTIHAFLCSAVVVDSLDRILFEETFLLASTIITEEEAKEEVERKLQEVEIRCRKELGEKFFLSCYCPFFMPGYHEVAGFSKTKLFEMFSDLKKFKVTAGGNE